MNKKVFAFCFTGLLAVAPGHAMDLKSSRLTQVVNDVQIISAADQAKKNAAVNDIFAMPDILRTGAGSRAELVAQDETVTRVGANTIFSFDAATRTIDLKQGSLLFHSPHGKGGGTIHTGSATASVLGTTLIVTTTPNGGMKVLDLEGQVQVNFTNRLKQKLAPGQMTFILPGGSELAPVIIFRLDELTRESLLVHGFSQPLASLPLIQNQVNQQVKLIKSGRATDTGLLVGNTATPNQVEVLDPNTVQTIVNPANLVVALGTDATLTQPSLTDVSVPTPPQHAFPNESFSLPNSHYFGNRLFTGFAARNLFINPQATDPLTVDLSPYANQAEFDLVAADNLTLAGKVVFGGFSPQHSLYFALIAGNEIVFAPSTSVIANIGNFELSAAGPLTVGSSQLLNSGGSTRFNSGSELAVNNSFVYAAGDVGFSSVGNVTLAGSTITANNVTISPVGRALTINASTLNVAQSATLSAAGAVTINNSSLNANPGNGQIAVSAGAHASVNISGTAIQAHFLTVNSGDGILLDGNGGALMASGPGTTAIFTAPNLVSVKNANFSSFGAVNMAANTVNLTDVNFGAGSSVMLKSLLGQLNLGASVPGDVNFIQNVTYGGNPAQNYVNNGGGITVTTLH